MAEEKEIQKKETQAKEAAPAKGSRKWLVSAIIIVFLAGGGAGAYLYLGKAGGGEGEGPESAAQSAETGRSQRQPLIYPLDSFIVNLMDNSSAARRYLKVTMSLEVDGEANKTKTDRHKVQLRDTIILLLSAQGFDDISTLEGKLGLKQEIQARVNQILGAGTVSKIYFMEFVVQ